MSEKRIEELLLERQELDRLFLAEEEKFNELRQTIVNQAKQIESELAQLCEHDFTRENHPYCPLYCRRCQLDYDKVYRLNYDAKLVN